MNAEIQEVSFESVLSRLNSKKEAVAEVVRAVKAQNKVGLMFAQGKLEQRMYIRHIKRLKTNKQVIADLF